MLLDINEYNDIFHTFLVYLQYTNINQKFYNFTFIFLKTACHADPGAEIERAESGLYTLRQIIREFLKEAANYNVPL